MNGSGTYSLSGSGYLAAPFEVVGFAGSGSFAQMGGTNSSATMLYLGYNAGGSGSYALAGGSLFAPQEYVGYASSGCFSQTGGTNSATSYLAVGYTGAGVGSYNLSGGSLSAAESIHRLFRHRQLHADGRHELRDNSVYLGDSAAPGGIGSYNLSSSGYLAAASQYVGYSGTGSITQTGGTNSATTALYLGYNPGGSGSYNLDGGLLLIGSGGITQGSGDAAFNFGGGTLGATAPWSSSINMTLTGSGGNATIDTTGGNIGLAGVLSGSGGLNKVNPGTLSLASPNTYSGSTSILAGTLVLANSNAVTNSTVNLLANNGLEFLPGIGTFNLGGLAGGNVLALSDTAGSPVTLSVGGNGASTTYSGNISGSGGLVKVGTGMLTLSGLNVFLGGSTISAGALAFGGTGVLGAGAVTIGPSGALVATPTYNPTAPVSGWLASGAIAASPSGAIVLPNGTIDNESIALSATTSGLSLGTIGSATYGGSLTTAGSTVYLGGGGGTLYFASSISGTQNLYVNTRGVPDGSVVLSGADAFGGNLVVDSGTLQLPSGTLSTTFTSSGHEYVGYSGTGTVTQTGGTNSVGTTLVLGQNAGSFGTYNLFGGLLVVSSVTQGSGSGSLNISGGSLTAATGALTVAAPDRLDDVRQRRDIQHFEPLRSPSRAKSAGRAD